MTVTMQELDYRNRYYDEIPTGMLVSEEGKLCDDFAQQPEKIKNKLWASFESNDYDADYEVRLQTAHAEERGGHVWVDENPQEELERLKDKARHATSNSMRKKARADIDRLRLGDLHGKFGIVLLISFYPEWNLISFQGHRHLGRQNGWETTLGPRSTGVTS